MNRIVIRSRWLHLQSLIGVSAIAATLIAFAIYIALFDTQAVFILAWCVSVATCWVWSFPWRVPLREKLVASTDGLESMGPGDRRFIAWSDIQEFNEEYPESNRFADRRAAAVLRSGEFVRLSGVESPVGLNGSRRDAASALVAKLNEILGDIRESGVLPDALEGRIEI